jgi:hypothetical protein
VVEELIEDGRKLDLQERWKELLKLYTSRVEGKQWGHAHNSAPPTVQRKEKIEKKCADQSIPSSK